MYFLGEMCRTHGFSLFTVKASSQLHVEGGEMAMVKEGHQVRRAGAKEGFTTPPTGEKVIEQLI